jgi:hypothetical protein
LCIVFHDPLGVYIEVQGGDRLGVQDDLNLV